MSDSVIPWTVVCQASLSMEFSTQVYRSEFPFPSPKDIPDPGIKPVFPTLEGGFFNTELPGKLLNIQYSPPKRWVNLAQPVNSTDVEKSFFKTL